MKIVENARSCWKHYSTIALASAGGIQGMMAALPDVVKDDIPKEWFMWAAKITTVIIALGLIGKFVKQGDKPKDLS